MNALILSCGTGGGHNAAAEAIRGELLRRGWNAELLNPYILCGKIRLNGSTRHISALSSVSPQALA